MTKCQNLIYFLIFLIQVNCELKIEKELKVALDSNDLKKTGNDKKEILKIPISQKAGKELFEHWINQAFSGLISAIAMRRLPLVEEYDKKKHEKCSSEAKNIVKHAKCLIELENDSTKNRLLKRKKYFAKKKLKKENEWIGEFRTGRSKREIKIKNQSNYELKSENDRSPFGIITKHLTNAVKILKNKKEISRWQTTIERIKNEAKIIKKRKEIEKMMRERMKIFEEKSRKFKNQSIGSIGASGSSGSMEKRKNLKNYEMKKFASMEKYIEDEELKEMFYQKTSNMTDDEKIMMAPMDIIRQAAKLGLSLGGKNVSDFEGKTIRMISPRFMSILPEEEQTKNDKVDILSPSLFSLHDEGNGIEKNTSIKNILGKAMDSSDTQNLLDLLVEITGVSEAIEDAEKKMLDADKKKGKYGEELQLSKENITRMYPKEAKKIEIFEKLETIYTKKQLKEFNETGYSILTNDQMNLIYGQKSPFKNSKILKIYQNMTKSELNRALHTNIKDIAQQKLKFDVRQKDIVLSPILNTLILNNPVTVSQPVVLSPVVMTALVQSPAIFGSVILSPWLFVPVILSPRILGPIVLTPFMFVPIILSPLALMPLILSPGVMNPLVLSPILLSPFILSPQVMTPLILSPYALTPLILNPMLLSPLILSPFVLSPQILSPQYVTGIILSPYALSPAIASDGKMVTVFASPSWLS